MRRGNFEGGNWNFICQICGFKRKASDGIERWDGLMVCRPSINPGCWETRHPQELIRPIPDQQKLPWTRPESADIIAYPNLCTAITRQGAADLGTANCAAADLNFGYLNQQDITHNG